ncbi:hypothetical protein AAG747_04830 [Rapidithrix thailandica]|uniref:Uncharacterized protein n=1 Tax=Rapidithrix thailandica TaxID=413964 RepID=A0AAW9S674_9BACT
MCRYSTVYKPHYACFACRKAFKRRLLVDIDRDAAFDKKWEPTIAKCPDCGEMMADMGLDFKSPPKKERKAWEHLQNLYEAGITFHSCGCSGPGYIPKDREQLLAYLEKKRTEYFENLKFWNNCKSQKEVEFKKQKGWENVWKFFYDVPKEAQTGTRKKQKVDVDKALGFWTAKIRDVNRKINTLK